MKFIGGARMLELSCWISRGLKMRPLDRLETSETYYAGTRIHVPEQRRRQMLHFVNMGTCKQQGSKLCESVNRIIVVQ